MRAFVVYCHPKTDSFNHAILQLVLEKLDQAGAEVRVSDLYAKQFQPVLSKHELDIYLDCDINQEPVQEEVDNVQWCDTLIFVYPTWWYGLPAMLKGWLDRVLLPDVAFMMPDAENSNIRPGLTHITRLGVFTTCGASWRLTRLIGAPGRRTLMRGVRYLCAKSCKTTFAAHYLMDSSTAATRAAHLKRVSGRLDRFLGIPAATRKSQGVAHA
ncbi:MAG: NAD(P)H-dependent oxidoreductase [Pseudomonadota bacterium]